MTARGCPPQRGHLRDIIIEADTMISLIRKRVNLSTSQNVDGEIDQDIDKLMLLASLWHVRTAGELLIDWEDTYIHLGLGPGVIRFAQAKSDAFQFGRLLAQMANLRQEEIDEAYQKIKAQSQEAGGHSPPQRIGSLLVAAHLISPHMIGWVLRTQILERTLRLMALPTFHFTFEPRSQDQDAKILPEYPYLDGSTSLDEVLFHALIWRTSIKSVRSVIDYVEAYAPVLKIPEAFQIPSALETVCRKEPGELDKEFVGDLRGKSVPLTHVFSQRPEAFYQRLIAAWILVFPSHWKLEVPEPDTVVTKPPQENPQ
jgi:hypothetical protein